MQNIANIENPVIVDGTVVAGDLPAHNNLGYYGNAGYRGEFNTQAHDLKVTYKADNYTVTGQLGYSKADGEVSDVYSEYYANTNASFTLENGTPDVTLSADLSPKDYRLDYNHKNDILNDSDELYVQFDVEYLLDTGFFTAIKAGIKYREHTKAASLMKANYPKVSAEVRALIWVCLQAILLAMAFYGSLIITSMQTGSRLLAQHQVLMSTLTTPSILKKPLQLDTSKPCSSTISGAVIWAYARLKQSLTLVQLSIQGVALHLKIFKMYIAQIATMTFLPSVNINYDFTDDVVAAFCCG